MAGRLAGRKKTQINGSDYDILPHPATEALVLVRRLGAFVELDREAPMKAITSLCMNSIKDDPKLELPLDILRHTQINGASVDKGLFDDHYAGNYGELIIAIKEVVTVNNFLGVLKDIGSLTK
jgi:hypothetical protein